MRFEWYQFHLYPNFVQVRPYFDYTNTEAPPLAQQLWHNITPETLLPSHFNISTESLVIYYHGLLPKFKYKEICSIITSHHSRSLTMSRIKPICKSNGLNRRRNVSDEHLCKMIENELNKSLSCVGYCQMTENL